MAQSLPTARQGLGEPQQKGARVLAPRINPPHAQKTLQSGLNSPDRLLAQIDVDRQARKATRRLNTRPSHDLADYAGDYDHPGYSRITITHADGKLNWAYRGMSAPLAHRHYDIFELPEAAGRLLPDRLAISFSTDREGNIASLAAPFEPLVKDIVFARVPAGDCMNPPSVSAAPACSARESRLVLPD